MLDACERFTDSGQVENYSLYTANLWEYARSKVSTSFPINSFKKFIWILIFSVVLRNHVHVCSYSLVQIDVNKSIEAGSIIYSVFKTAVHFLRSLILIMTTFSFDDVVLGI